MKISDCTFRDCGYQTDWHFGAEIVSKYFKAMEKSKIEYIEIGFKFPNSANNYGPFAYVNSHFVKSLDITHKFRLGVMINLIDFISNNTLDKKLLRESFTGDIEYIHFVRIATLSLNVLQLNEASNILREMGFEVHINLMQISELNSLDLDKFCKKLDNEINLLTIADTFGVLTPKDIDRIFKIVQNSRQIEMGLHAHDNCGLALANSLEAADLGFNFIDSTVSGIGRAAGNLRTEFKSIFSKESKSYNLLEDDLLLNLSHNDFAKLNSKNSWGPNVIYFVGAQLKVHPNNLMSLVKDSFGKETKILPLFDISQIESKRDAVSQNLGETNQTFGATSPISKNLREGFLEGVEVFLLGNGPFIHEFKEEIEKRLVQLNRESIVVSTTLDPAIDINLVSHFVIYDRNKFDYFYNQRPNYYNEFFKSSGAKLILVNELSSSLSEIEFFVFPETNVSSRVGLDRHLHYSLSVINFGNPLKVTLLGFDGFANDISRNSIIQNCLNFYLENDRLGSRFFSGTPSLYNIPSRSFFSL
jgi:4-hydroxy 2-oxovalerate aldolase